MVERESKPQNKTQKKEKEKMYYTWISKKQIGIIFANYKRGNINLTEEHIKWLYAECAEVKGFNNNNHLEDILCRVRRAIDSIFSNNYAEAEKAIIASYDLYNKIFA